MTRNEVYIRQMEQWMEAQRLGIESCDMYVKHAEAEIEMLKKRIHLEIKEKAAKQLMLDHVIGEIEEIKAQIQTNQN